MRAARSGSRSGSVCDRDARAATRRRSARSPRMRRVVLPARDLRERVGADHEEQLRRPIPALVELLQRAGRVRRRRRAQLEIRRAPAGSSGHRQRDHREAVEARRERLRPVRRDVRRDHETAGRGRARVRAAAAEVEVTAVNRIEGAAEDADASTVHAALRRRDARQRGRRAIAVVSSRVARPARGELPPHRFEQVGHARRR